MDEARSNYDEAAQGFSALAHSTRQIPSTDSGSATSRTGWASCCARWKAGAPTAEAAYDRALPCRRRSQREFPDNVDYRQELARTHYNRGILRAEQRRRGGRRLPAGRSTC